MQKLPLHDNPRILFRLLAAGHVVLIAVTFPLWLPQTDFPQIPLIAAAGAISPAIEWLMLSLLIGSLTAIGFTSNLKILRFACLVSLTCNVGLILIDQHRLQPWVWEFVVVSLLLAVADVTTVHQSWQWLVIGIYAWSAWSKIDYGFCLQHGPFLLDGLCKALHLPAGTQAWPPSVRFTVSAAIPALELAIAWGLSFRKTRTPGLAGAAIMHLGLLLALGPLGHNHKPGVLVWNVFFLFQNWLLFRDKKPIETTAPLAAASEDAQSAPQPAPEFAINSAGHSGQTNIVQNEEMFQFGNRIARLFTIAVLAWPALETFELCDHWPAWAVYAANPERVSVLISTSEVSKLPTSLIRYISKEPDGEEWHLFRIDRWSLDAVKAPIYPQDRFQVGVALDLIDRFHLDHLRITIEGPANRWTGRRIARRFEGPNDIRQQARSYRFNAIPRNG